MEETIKKQRNLPKNSPLTKLPFGGISAITLKLIAMAAMLSDHMWATVIPGNPQWMTWIGRIAFPIFAFQAAEGVIHTRNFKKYVYRLLIFAVISEIPYNLLMEGGMIDPFDQNVMFTLLLGILGCKALENALRKKTVRSVILGIVLAVLCVFVGQFGMVDYGGRGVLMVILFYLLRDFPFAWLAQLAAILIVFFFTFEGHYIPVTILGHTFDLQTQGFSAFSLVPIWLYNNQKGGTGKVMKYVGYAFYPVHIVILYLIARLIGAMMG